MNTTHIIGVFDSKSDLLAGIESAKSKNITIDEIYTPYPVMEAIDALGRKSRFTDCRRVLRAELQLFHPPIPWQRAQNRSYYNCLHPP